MNGPTDRPAPPQPFPRPGSLRRKELKARIDSDFEALPVFRSGLAASLHFFRSNEGLLPRGDAPSERVLDRGRKAVLMSAWQALLDRYLALDSIASGYQDFFAVRGRALRTQAFLLHYAAFAAEYRFALEFIALAEESSEADLLLNEPVPGLGLPAGTYETFKARFLNVSVATRFALLSLVRAYLATDSRPGVQSAAEEDAGALAEAGMGEGEALTAKNALQVLKKASYQAWFPVQAGVSEWMGQTKVLRQGRALITREQVRSILPRLRPGDILLERREWYLSNIGLPGFWCHAALFVGTPADRRALFSDEGIAGWVRAQGCPGGDFEELLARRWPEAYAACTSPQEEGLAPRVLEAIRLGVVFTTLEHSASADSLAVLRPRLARREIALALLGAFGYAGLPYDFDFDFRTDSALVCSELVFKAYGRQEGAGGLSFPLTEILGRVVCPANDMARVFDEEYDSPKRQMDLVLFLDGQEGLGEAVESGADEFRQSWRRPKWHVLVQEPPKQLQEEAR